MKHARLARAEHAPCGTAAQEKLELTPCWSLNVSCAHRQSVADEAPTANVWLVVGHGMQAPGGSLALRYVSTGHCVQTPVAPTMVPK